MDKKQSGVLGMIPARYGSTRFPGKLLVPIMGKTLIQRTYENALQCSSFKELIIVTDDKRIFDHVKSFGADVVMTSPDCANGTERIVEALKNNPRFDYASIIVNVQGDEPCVSPQALKQLSELLAHETTAHMSTAVVPLFSIEEALNPSVVKCVLSQQGDALYFSRALIPANRTLGGLSPHAYYYQHLGLYAYRREFLMKYADLTPTPLQLAEDLEQLKVLEHGYRIKAVIVDSCNIGVNEPEDIPKLEQYLCKQNLSLSQAESVRLSVKG